MFEFVNFSIGKEKRKRFCSGESSHGKFVLQEAVYVKSSLEHLVH